MVETFLHRDLRGQPRQVPVYDLMKALTVEQSLAWQGLKMTDQLRLLSRPTPIPEDNPVLARAADKLGTTPEAWFDAAGAPASIPAA